MKLVYTASAVDDLERLRTFLVGKNPPAARQTVKRLRDAALRLRKHPLLGIAMDRDPSLRDLIVGDYLIRYRVCPQRKTITIMRIWHGKENLRE